MRLEALVDRLHVLLQMRSTEKVFRADVAIVFLQIFMNKFDVRLQMLFLFERLFTNEAVEGFLVFVHILLVFVQRGFCCEVLAADQTCEFFDPAMNDIDVNF